MYELNFNLTDVTLKGTENHISQMEEVINKFQVRLNKDKMGADAYAYCINNDKNCANILNDKVSQIYSGVHANIYSGYNTKTRAEKLEVRKTATKF